MLRRWLRRVLMIGSYVAAFGVIQALAPLLVVMLGVYDLVRGNGLPICQVVDLELGTTIVFRKIAAVIRSKVVDA